METTLVYLGYIGIMKNKMETTIVYWGFIGTVENQTETAIDPRDPKHDPNNRMLVIVKDCWAQCRYYLYTWIPRVSLIPGTKAGEGFKLSQLQGLCP